MSDKKPERRDFLFTASYAVGAVGVAAVVWPLVDQMNPDASVKAYEAVNKKSLLSGFLSGTISNCLYCLF